jgi:hypothetical protein
MKRCPTEPVAPRTPTIESVNGNMIDLKIRTALFLGEVWIARGKVFSVHVCGCWLECFLCQLDFLSRMTRGWGFENATPIAEIRSLVAHPLSWISPTKQHNVETHSSKETNANMIAVRRTMRCLSMLPADACFKLQTSAK